MITKNSLRNLEEMPKGYIFPADKSKWPAILAEIFVSLDSNQQAEFFDVIGLLDETECNNKLIFQWRYMSDSLTARAKMVIANLFEHTD